MSDPITPTKLPDASHKIKEIENYTAITNALDVAIANAMNRCHPSPHNYNNNADYVTARDQHVSRLARLKSLEDEFTVILEATKRIKIPAWTVQEDAKCFTIKHVTRSTAHIIIKFGYEGGELAAFGSKENAHIDADFICAQLNLNDTDGRDRWPSS